MVQCKFLFYQLFSLCTKDNGFYLYALPVYEYTNIYTNIRVKEAKVQSHMRSYFKGRRLLERMLILGPMTSFSKCVKKSFTNKNSESCESADRTGFLAKALISTKFTDARKGILNTILITL